MKRRTMAAAAAVGTVLLSGTGAAAAATHPTAAVTGAAGTARADRSGGTWGRAEQVPGLAVLNKGGLADFNAISCPSAGDCAAGGSYFGSSRQQAFVASESGGRWRKAEEVPGLAAFHQSGQFGAASVISVSCAAAGDCAAGGFYYIKAHDQQGFVVNETNGRWGGAQRVPGLAALNTERYAGVTDVSCASPGNCSAVGAYSIPVDGFAYSEAYVVNETDGSWGKAEEVPGTAALNVGGDAGVISVSCASAGNCSAGGGYASSNTALQALVVSEVNGRWGKAEKVPGTAALNLGGDAEVNSVSCGSPGNCAAGGYYTDSAGKSQAFVVSEVNGRWGKAEEVPGTAALNLGGDAQLDSVSCPSAGNCAAGGEYFNKPGKEQLFVVSEAKGTWGMAEEVPGSAALNKGAFAYISQVSCASPGNCSAGGSYAATPVIFQAFVVSEVNGTWAKAEQVPGSDTLNNAGFAGTFALSCPVAGQCGAGGYYTYQAPGNTHQQSAFVVSQTSG